MEPPSPQPFAHANESDAAPWLRPLLEHIGVPAGRAATISAAEAPTTTGAIRELRSRPAHWNAFLDKLSGMLVSELGDTLDREDIRQRLLERLEEELDAVHVKRARTEAAGSSTEAQFASATTESEEVLRTKQWCNRQPIIVSRFVLRVLPPRSPRRNLWVVCKCGHECLDCHFRTHVISGQHEKEFFELLNNSEALGAQAAVLRVAEMLRDLGQRATREQMAAEALRPAREEEQRAVGGRPQRRTPRACAASEPRAVCDSKRGQWQSRRQLYHRSGRSGRWRAYAAHNEPERGPIRRRSAVEKDLMDMKVTELKEELASRDEPVSGNKAWLRRRLHAAIVREHLEAASEE
jgi:hypothetical protein